MIYCPSHDIAGWRKGWMPARPRRAIDLPPDWVCEIVSPGHERQDTPQNSASSDRSSGRLTGMRGKRKDQNPFAQTRRILGDAIVRRRRQNHAHQSLADA